MSTDAITTMVHRIVAAVLSRDESDISNTSHLVRDLGAKDLDKIDIALRTEDAFEPLEISDDEMEAIATVWDLVALVQAKTAAMEVA